MTIFQSLLLGLIQGLTEYIPVSSSAHLVLVPWLLGWNIPAPTAFVFDVLVQLGTLAAVIVYFRRDLWCIVVGVIRAALKGKPFEGDDARLGWLIVLATLPAGLAGLLLKDYFESVFGKPVWVAALLLVTAALLAFAEWFARHRAAREQPTWLDALLIGLFQALAILPGLSRSGATIAGGLTRGLTRPAAARFAFLMSVPIMLAAGLLAGKDLLGMSGLAQLAPVILAGFVTSALVGFAVIVWLLRWLRTHTLYIFSVYCALAGLTSLIIALLRG